MWPPEVELQGLPSWRAVLKAISDEPDLARQFDQLVGAADGSSSHVEPRALSRHVLPEPDEFDRADEIFEERYQEFEEFLLAKRLCTSTAQTPSTSSSRANVPTCTRSSRAASSREPVKDSRDYGGHNPEKQEGGNETRHQAATPCVEDLSAVDRRAPTEMLVDEIIIERHPSTSTYARLREPDELIEFGGGFDPEAGGFARLPEGF